MCPAHNNDARKPICVSFVLLQHWSLWLLVDAETLLLEVDTYYMTKKNYEEMKGGKITEVIIPINNDEYTKRNTKYRVPLTAVIFHYSPVFGCIIQAPYKTQVMRPQEVQQYMSKMVYMLSGSLLAQSGLYTFTCSGKQPNFVTGLIQRMIVSKSLRLRFVRGTSEAV